MFSQTLCCTHSFSAWARVLRASRVERPISTDTACSRRTVDVYSLCQPCFLLPRPPPTQRTSGGPSGDAAPSARRVNRPRVALGVAASRGAAPALLLSPVTRTGDAGGHTAAAGRQGTSGARGTLRSNFRKRSFSGRPLQPPARSALSSRDVPRRPKGECRAPWAPRSLERRVRLSYAVYIPGMTHFHQPRGRMLAYARGQESRNPPVADRIPSVPKPKK